MFESYFEKDEDKKLHAWAAKMGSEIKDPKSEDRYTEYEIEIMLKSLSSGGGKMNYGFNHNSLTKMINIIRHKGGEAYWQPISSIDEFNIYFEPEILREMKSNGYKYMAIIGNWCDGEITKKIQREFPEEFQNRIVCMTDYNNDLTFLYSTIPVNSNLKQLLKPIGTIIDVSEKYCEYCNNHKSNSYDSKKEEKNNANKENYDIRKHLHPDVINSMLKAGYSEEEIADKYKNRRVIKPSSR